MMLFIVSFIRTSKWNVTLYAGILNYVFFVSVRKNSQLIDICSVCDCNIENHLKCYSIFTVTICVIEGPRSTIVYFLNNKTDYIISITQHVNTFR